MWFIQRHQSSSGYCQFSSSTAGYPGTHVNLTHAHGLPILWQLHQTSIDCLMSHKTTDAARTSNRSPHECAVAVFSTSRPTVPLLYVHQSLTPHLSLQSQHNHNTPPTQPMSRGIHLWQQLNLFTKTLSGGQLNLLCIRAWTEIFTAAHVMNTEVWTF